MYQFSEEVTLEQIPCRFVYGISVSKRLHPRCQKLKLVAQVTRVSEDTVG